MMIPLRKSQFTIYKSNLKILEAAGKGIPVIVSSTHPYMGFPEDLVNYAGDDSMWMHWVDKLHFYCTGKSFLPGGHECR